MQAGGRWLAIIQAREVKIATNFHPLRWTVAAALAIPLCLLVAFIFARTSGNDSVAEQTVRFLRYVVAGELLCGFLLATIGLLYERRAEQRDRDLYPPPGNLLDIGGYRLHLHCAGRGQTVVLEYGHQGNYTDWYRVQPELAEFARVCVYDRAGYGWSDRSSKPRVPGVMAEELHSLLHTAGETPPFILIGHSFGGLDALMLAHKFPSEVAGVVLVDASLPEMMSALRWRDRGWLRLMQTIVPFGLPRWRGWCGGSGPQEIRGLKQAITCRSSLYGTYYREWSSFPESAAEARAITNIGDIPLIVIARDPEVAGSTAREMKWNELQKQRTTLSSNSKFVVATGSGHDVPLERPDVITAAVKKLVENHARSSVSPTPSN